MITRTGIFTFYPSLNSFSYSYNFTDAQIMQDTLNSMEGTMNQVEISQFTDEEGGKRYVVCIANNYIYFMDEKENVKEDKTKYGEFVSSFFAWKTLDKEKEIAKKLEDITKENKK